MSDLKKCPCGQVPDELVITAAANGPKYATASGACCDEWHVEFRTVNFDSCSDESMERAVDAWNIAGRE